MKPGIMVNINNIVFLKVCFLLLAHLRYKRTWQEKIYSLGLLGNFEIMNFFVIAVHICSKNPVKHL